MSYQPDSLIQALGSFTVRASAGSGKTYYLVSKIVACLLSGANPDSILAITFTRKAAAEMQQRVIERLRHFSLCDETTLKQELAKYHVTNTSDALINRARSLYQSILLNPYNLHISTFHAFCQEILHRFALESDIPPGSTPLEKTYALRELAWERLMQQARQHPDAELAQQIDILFGQFELSAVKNLLQSFIHNRTSWWAYTQDQAQRHSKNLLSKAYQRLQDFYNIDPEHKPLDEFAKNEILLKKIKNFQQLLLNHVNKTNTSFANDINTGIELLATQVQAGYDLLRSVFITGEGGTRKRSLSKAIEKNLGDKAEQYIELHESLAETFHNHDEMEKCRINYQMIRAWYVVGQHYLDYFQHSKQEQRALDFDDLEWKTFQLLTASNHAQWIQYKIDNRLSHVLVDEFQDTNQLQWRYLKALLEELGSDHDKISSAVIVGDTKQSIYRFRRAEPMLFSKAEDWLKQTFAAQTEELHQSYRSSPAVMDFVNDYFARLTNENNPDTSFSSHSAIHQDLPGAVSLLQAIIPEIKETETVQTFRNPLTSPRPGRDATQYYYQAEAIAGKIEALLQQNLWIKDGNTQRPLQYSDIFILFRNRTNVAEYEYVLQQHNIPYVGLERGGLLDALEVRDIIALLTWLVTPHDNLSLAQILRSPIFSVSNETLMAVSAHGKGNWFDRIEKFLAENETENTLLMAHQCLSRWRELALTLPVHDLLDLIYSEANIFQRYQMAFPKHIAMRTTSNLLQILEIALEIDSGRYPGLQSFIYEIQNMQQAAEEMPDAPPLFGLHDRVQFLTIHAAKGLESPVVFVADMGNTPSDRSANTTLVDWPLDAPQPRMMLPVFKKDLRDKKMSALLEQKLASEAHESLNLRYVAFTRAAQYLYLVGDTRAAKGSWFAQLCELYDLNATDPEIELFQHAGTSLESTDPIHQSASQIEAHVLPELQRPVNVKSDWHEIAPSYNTDNHSQNTAHEHGTLRGILIHALMDVLTSNTDASKDVIQKRLGVGTSDTTFDHAWQEARAVIEHAEFDCFFNPSEYQTARNEVPLLYEQNGKTVNGVIDRLIVTDSTVSIVDYKSHQISLQEVASVAENYIAQMRYYHEGIKRIWPEKTVRCYLLFTAIPHIYEIQF